MQQHYHASSDATEDSTAEDTTQSGAVIVSGDREKPAPVVPVDYDDLALEDVLYDRHRQEYFVVEGLDGQGIELHQDGTEFFVPHSLFVPWYGSRVFKATKMSNADLPTWV